MYAFIRIESPKAIKKLICIQIRMIRNVLVYEKTGKNDDILCALDLFFFFCRGSERGIEYNSSIEGPVVSLLRTPWVKQPVTEGAAQCCQCVLHGV